MQEMLKVEYILEVGVYSQCKRDVEGGVYSDGKRDVQSQQGNEEQEIIPKSRHRVAQWWTLRRHHCHYPKARVSEVWRQDDS